MECELGNWVVSGTVRTSLLRFIECDIEMKPTCFKIVLTVVIQGAK